MIIHLVTSYFSCHRIGQVDPHIAEWAYSTTHAKKSDNAYRIQRNSSAVAYAWREGKKPLTPRQNQIAIRKCGDVLTKLEYETEREITEALQKPLPAPIWTAHSGRRVPSGRYKYNRDGRQKKYWVGFWKRKWATRSLKTIPYRSPTKMVQFFYSWNSWSGTYTENH